MLTPCVCNIAFLKKNTGFDWMLFRVLLCQQSSFLLNMATYSCLLRIMSRQVLNVSKGGDASISLDSSCLCSVILKLKCFLMLRWHLLYFSLSPLPLVLWLGTAEDSLARSSLQPPFRFIDINKILLVPCLLQAEQSHLSHSFLVGEMLLSLHHPRGPSLDSIQHGHVSCTGHTATPVLSWGEESPPLMCWQHFAWCSPVPVFAARAQCCHPPGSPNSLLPGSFPGVAPSM